MENLSIFWGVLLAIAAAISAIGGAWKYIKEIKKPYDNLKSKVETLLQDNEKMKKDLKELEEKLKNYVDKQDEKTIEKIKDLNEDINSLKQSLEANEKDTKLILKEIFHLSSYITSGDKDNLQKLLGVNSEILNHLIDTK